MVDYNMQVVQPVNIADELGKWGALKKQDQEAKLIDMKIAQAPQQQAFDQQRQTQQLAQGQQELDLGRQKDMIQKHMMAKDISTGIKAKMDAWSAQTGQAPGTPAFQQQLDSISAPLRPILANTFGVPNTNDPMHWDSIVAVADSTPGEQQQAAIQGEIAKRRALQPLDLEQKRAEYGLKNESEIEKEQRALAGQKELKTFESNLPKAPNEFQQYQLDQKRAEKEKELQGTKFEIQNSLEKNKELQDLQEKTSTGPLASNAITANLRKLGSEIGLDNFTGGNNLSLLEAGYAEQSLRALAAFKSIGVTFGQLSNAEGDWVRKTKEKLNSNGVVNMALLKEGEKLLKDRMAMIDNGKVPNMESNNNSVQSTQYSSPDELKAAVRSGSLPMEQAATIARQQGWIQ